MNKMKRTIFLFAFMIIVASMGFSQWQAERLNRGLVAIKSGNGYFLSWRLLGDEPSNTGFHVYKGNTRLTSTPVINSTTYQDNSTTSDTYRVSAVINGVEQEFSENARVMSANYLDVPLSTPSGSGTTYTSNDVSVGDLDGDSEYELVVKWEPANAQDNSKSGYTGNVFLDAYELNGTPLWRIDLGRNIRAGAHYTQFMVYDLDGDGKAEIACKTADGTIDGQGKVIGNGSADYRNSNGYILDGPEFLTVFNGQTGAAINTVNYLPARGNVGDWGDTYGNRVDRFLACVAYLDGQKPSLVMCRGYYTRTVLVAWDYKNANLTQRWTFDTNNGYGSTWEGQGNHQLSVQDVDSDGKDEIIYGSIAIDDNGRGIWNARLGHGDSLHVCDIDVNRPGLEVWGIHEGDGTPGSALLDARTGQIIWQTANADIGRGVSADLTSSPGMECWGGTEGLRTASNGSAGNNPPSANHLIWWDGDLYRELLDSNTITKYGGSVLLTGNGCTANNGTKFNPSLTLDLWGDWREEVIWRAGSSLRIYTSTSGTNYRFHTLMHDRAYREAVAWQNVAYNQPPHPSFFLGEGMKAAPQPNIYYPGGPVVTPEPTPTPDPVQPGTRLTLQAEDAYFTDGIIESIHSGYTGAGYVNCNNQAGPFIEWEFILSQGTTANCTFIFSNGGTASRPGTITVNGNEIAINSDFPATGDWTIWSEKTFNATFMTGSNIIRLTGTGSEGLANIDRLDIQLSAVNTPVPEPPVLIGDVNGDKVANIVDALLIAKHYVGILEETINLEAADTNCDNTINIVDALLIAQYYVGLINSLC
ncbi:MAG: hypothetical protein JXR70_18870 [Spirochaetales bacterium]|nr:hypothetical protein [Spirochaetales bacterium]